LKFRSLKNKNKKPLEILEFQGVIKLKIYFKINAKNKLARIKL